MDKNPIRTTAVAHLAAIPRRFPAALPLTSLGHLAAKPSWIHTAFSTVNFSCILAGRGTYTWNGTTHAVTAPTVLTQWPGAYLEYGPDSTWRELFLIYPGDTEAHLRSLGILDQTRPCWSIATPGPFLDAADALLRCFLRQRFDEDIDRLDRLAERLVLEAHLGAAAPAVSPAEAIIIALRDDIDQGQDHAADPEAEALRRGLSRSHFRRLWGDLIGIPPARYVAERRLRIAARRLAEEDATVATIATDLGFTDPLYFSRRFKAFLGVSPGIYRQRHRASLRGIG